jgi:hypothetical protein
MLLHLKFCIEWFELNSKGNSKYIWKMLWKIGKEKEKDFFSLFSFWPISARVSLSLGLTGSQPSNARPRLLLTPRVAHSPLPAFPLGPSPASHHWPS